MLRHQIYRRFARSHRVPFAGGDYGFARRTGAAVAGGVPVIDPIEPINALQLVTLWGGYASEGCVEAFYDCNEPASPLNATIGSAAITTTVGTPTLGVTHALALDGYDKAAQFTDAQGAQMGTGNGAITFGSEWGFAWWDVAFSGALPAADRQIGGHDAAADVIGQIRTTGRFRGIFVGNVGGTIVTNEIAVNHYDSARHTIALMWRAGASCRAISDLGDTAPVSTAAVGTYDLAASWFLGRNLANPACTIFNHGVLKSHNAAEQTAMQALWDNLPAALAAWRTNTGQ